MFFSDNELVTRKRATLKQLPSIPETGWRPPKEYRDLSKAIFIGFDFEVKENDLDHGPGWSRGKASIVGGALDAYFADGSTHSEYRPIRHEVEPEYNLDPETTIRYWRDVLQTPHIPKGGANLIYDCGNAADEGITVQGELHDCQFSEALIDETGFVDLDYLGKKYLGEGKETSLVYQWLADAYGGEPTGKQRENLWRCSPRLVGPYAETDAKHPRRIIANQWPQLVAENLTHLYRMECGLIPLWVKMRRQGVRIDVKKAEEMYVKLGPEIIAAYKRLFELSGVRAEATTGKDIIKVFKALNIQTPMTDKGNPSITKEYLNGLNHPVADIVLEIRSLEICRNTFLDSYLLGSNINGIIHGEFHPLRGDDGGTRTGRLSSSNPNLQNIPVRTDLGKEIRKCFLPFEGHLCWEKGDFSQIQYRGLAHYAVGPGSDELRQAYIDNPDTDYHDQTQLMVKQNAGIDVPRKPIKNLNFGIMFGAGKAKVKRMLTLDGSVTTAQSDQFYVSYHKANPYVKATMQAMMLEASTLGFITSPLGRRTRFNLWEPVDTNYEDRAKPLPYQQAIREYGQIKRALTHTAISGRLQGVEADIIKTAMHKAYYDGVYDVIGVPALTVHDENGQSVIDESPRQKEAYAYLGYTMENTVRLRVPVRFVAKRGSSWGAID